MTQLSPMTPSPLTRPASAAGRRALRAMGLTLVALLLVAGSVIGSPGAASAAAGDPIGVLDSVTAPPGAEQVVAEGWAFDPDSATPVRLVTRVDGVEVTSSSAVLPRADVGATVPGAGNNRGFRRDWHTGPGTHTVCVQAVNRGRGTNVDLGCRTVVVPGSSPFGNMDEVFVEDGIMTVTGWTIDPNTGNPIEAHLYVDGRGVAGLAGVPREDIATVYPAFGAYHGFEIPIDVDPGEHSVCVFGIDSDPYSGENTLLECRDVVVPDASPFGHLDDITSEDGIMTVGGWTIDPDTADPIEVHLYVDGRGVADVADFLRDDVAAVYPDFGPYHGFEIPVEIDSGEHFVCVFGIDVFEGQNTLLECRDVVTT